MNPIHAKLMNVLGRICGVGFIFVGAILTLYGIGWHDWVTVTISMITVVFGVLLLKAKPISSN